MDVLNNLRDYAPISGTPRLGLPMAATNQNAESPNANWDLALRWQKRDAITDGNLAIHSVAVRDLGRRDPDGLYKVAKSPAASQGTQQSVAPPEM